MANRLKNPFKGLQSYERHDKGRLFGRDKDLVLMRDRIFSARTTLLFAGSGVGKTSFLNAKVIPALSQNFFTFYFKEWAAKGEPLEAIKRALAEQLKMSDGSTSQPLCSFLGSFKESDASEDSGPQEVSRCLIIFDQFEEIFQYHSYEGYFNKFIDELCEVINADDLQARIVFSMREEFLGELSVFDNRIPDLFNNYYRLKYPDKREAEDIIVNTSRLARAEVDQKGLANLVTDLSRIEKGAGSFAERAANKEGSKTRLIERDFIVPPYLQIACRGLWDRQFSAEQNGEAKSQDFLSDYKDQDARSILRHFCNGKLSSLSFGERFRAARAFNFLVTKQGAKMAYELTRLSEHMIVSKKKLRQTLEKLSSPDTRILRESRGPDGSHWFELYHDMYGTIVDEWKRKVFSRVRNLAIITSASFLALLIFITIYVFPRWVDRPAEYKEVLAREGVEYKEALSAYQKLRDTFGYEGKADALWAGYWDRRALQEEIKQNRDKAIICWLEALAAEPEGKEAERRRIEIGKLAGGNYQSLITTYLHEKANRTPMMSADGDAIITRAADGSIRAWDIDTGTPILQLQSFYIELAGDQSLSGKSQKDRSAPSLAEPGGDKTDSGRRRDNVTQISADLIALRAAVKHDDYKLLVVGAVASDLQAPAPEVNAKKTNSRFFIWRADTGNIVMTLDSGVNAPANLGLSYWGQFAFSPNGKYLARGEVKGAVIVWDVSGREAILVKHIKQGINDFVFSPDSKYLVTTEANSIHLWDIKSAENDKVIQLKQEQRVVRMAFSPDGKSLLTQYDDASSQVWFVESGQPASQVLKLDNYPNALALGPDGKTIILGAKDSKSTLSVERWDSQTGNLLDVMNGLVGTDNIIDSQGNGTILAVRPNGEEVLVREGVTGRLIKIIERKTEAPVITNREGINKFALTSDGKVIATLSQAQKIQLWLADSFEPIGVPIDSSAGKVRKVQRSGEGTFYFALSPNGKFVAEAGDDNVVKMWEVGTVRKPLEITLNGKIPEEPGLSFSPDSRWLAIRHEGGIQFVDTYAYKPGPVLRWSGSLIRFSDDGKYLAVVGWFSEPKIWELPEGTEVALSEDLTDNYTIQTLAFADNKLIIGSGDGIVKVWDLTTAKDISIIEQQRSNRVSAVALSRDGKRVLTGGENGYVALWDIDRPDGKAERVGNSFDHKSPIKTVSFIGDGTTALIITDSWAHIFSIQSEGLRHIDSRLIGNLQNSVYIIDDTTPKIRFISKVSPNALEILDIDFTNAGSAAIEGSPAKLREEWKKRFGLGINGDGEIVPLNQGESDDALDEEKTKQTKQPGG